ncbi:hypothetical protein ACLIA0_01050 [Bacillaceae bacterium W0354]
MDNERKKIILNEIKHWKQSNLLPTQYCDFLIALYTEGEGLDEEKSTFKDKQRGNLLLYLDIIFLLLLIPFSFYVTYIFDVGILIKIFIFLAIIAILAIHLYFYHKKKSIYIHLPLITLFLITLLGSISVSYTILGESFWVNGIILINCIIWVITGIYGKYLYLTLSGFIGIVILAIVIVI